MQVTIPIENEAGAALSQLARNAGQKLEEFLAQKLYEVLEDEYDILHGMEALRTLDESKTTSLDDVKKELGFV